MKNDPKVSLIIPVYNVGRFLDRCLDSVVNQDYRNIQIIIIDDCSTDNSRDIIQKYTKQDSRIVFLKNEKNSGVSFSRNKGIALADGKYICFLDSDDFISNGYIRKLVNTVERYKCEIVCNFNIIKFFDKDNKKNSLLKKLNLFPINIVMKPSDKILNKIPLSVWCKIYRTDFLKKNNLKFPEGLIYEDFYFWHALKTKLINGVVLINDPPLYYTQNPDSLMHKMYYKKVDNFDSIYIIYKLYNFYKDNNLLSKFHIPFKWNMKFFRMQKHKNIFFKKLKSLYQKIQSEGLDAVIYNKDKKSYIIFKNVIRSNSYIELRIRILLDYIRSWFGYIS